MTTIKWRWGRRGRSYIELPRRFINRRLRFDPEQNPVQKSSPNDTIQTITLQYRKDYYRVQTLRLYIFNILRNSMYKMNTFLRVSDCPTQMICTYLDIYWMWMREGIILRKKYDSVWKNAKEKYIPYICHFFYTCKIFGE